MGDERTVTPSRLTRLANLVYMVGSAALVWSLVKPLLTRLTYWHIDRKLGSNFELLCAQAAKQADRNWDAIQRVRGARLGRPIELADLETFDQMGMHYKWYYVENATRGAWLRWMSLERSKLIFGRRARMAELLRAHRDAKQRLAHIRETLLDFGVMEEFLYVTFRDTLTPAR